MSRGAGATAAGRGATGEGGRATDREGMGLAESFRGSRMSRGAGATAAGRVATPAKTAERPTARAWRGQKGLEEAA
jgi:hypothetical protein